MLNGLTQNSEPVVVRIVSRRGMLPGRVGFTKMELLDLTAQLKTKYDLV